MPVHGHQIGGLGSQVVSDRNFTPTGFVQHGYLHAVAEGGGFRYGYGINVFDSGIIAYSVISQIAIDMEDDDFISDNAVVQACDIDTRRHVEASRQQVTSSRGSDPDLSAEHDVQTTIRVKAIGHLHHRPIGALAVVAFQHGYFFFGQMPVYFSFFFHKSTFYSQVSNLPLSDTER